MRPVMLATLVGALAATCVGSGNAQEAQQVAPAVATPAATQQYPVVDAVADKVVQKFQSASCEQIAAQRGAPTTEQESRAVQALRADSGMQQEFINRVAAPIANKLFECNLIP